MGFRQTIDTLGVAVMVVCAPVWLTLAGLAGGIMLWLFAVKLLWGVMKEEETEAHAVIKGRNLSS